MSKREETVVTFTNSFIVMIKQSSPSLHACRTNAGRSQARPYGERDAIEDRHAELMLQRSIRGAPRMLVHRIVIASGLEARDLAHHRPIVSASIAAKRNST